jgi:hypothetical protein
MDLPKPQIPAALGTAERRHPNWAKVVLAAYFRSLGATQREAAKAAGCGERTVRGWEADQALWSAALETARELWAGEVDAAARGRVLEAIRDEDDTQTARWWLERTDRATGHPEAGEPDPHPGSPVRESVAPRDGRGGCRRWPWAAQGAVRGCRLLDPLTRPI